jgi:hypothetical protein
MLHHFRESDDMVAASRWVRLLVSQGKFEFDFETIAAPVVMAAEFDEFRTFEGAPACYAHMEHFGILSLVYICFFGPISDTLQVLKIVEVDLPEQSLEFSEAESHCCKQRQK